MHLMSLYLEAELPRWEGGAAAPPTGGKEPLVPLFFFRRGSRAAARLDTERLNSNAFFWRGTEDPLP
jgi:hypothetical protein